MVYRNIDRDRRRLQRTEWFHAHSKDEPRPFEMGSPLEEPPDDEDPPNLPAYSDRSRARNTDGPGGPQHDNPPRAAVQQGSVYGSNVGEASEKKPGDSPISSDDSLGDRSGIFFTRRRIRRKTVRRFLHVLRPWKRILRRLVWIASQSAQPHYRPMWSRRRAGLGRNPSSMRTLDFRIPIVKVASFTGVSQRSLLPLRNTTS